MNSDLPELQISDKTKDIPQALSIYMNQLVYSMKREGKKIMTLSLGEATFDIPLMNFNALDKEKILHYSDSMGIPELRMKIADYYNKNYNAQVDWKKELLISAGSKMIIYMALQAVLNTGDEVLIPEPAWLSYPEQVKLADGVPCYIPFDVPVEDYEKYFTTKTKVLIINNPNNPAGKIYSEEELKLLYKICRNRGCYLLVDEAYSDFAIDRKFTSLASVVPNKDGVIIVNSLSKNFGISGWRVGYIISSPIVIENVLKLNQHFITCAPTILLMYLEKYFDEMVKITKPQVKEVVEKRQIIEKYMDKIGLKHLEGNATFYFLVNIGNYNYSSLELAMYLLFKYNISVVPGLAYGKSVERFIRVGVGVETIEDLKEALNVIKKVIDNNEYDENIVDNELKKLGMKKFE